MTPGNESLPEIVDGLPNLSGAEALIERTVAEARDRPVFLADSQVAFDRIRSACAIALRVAAEVENATIVFVVCDRGDRYLSTGVFPA